MLPPPPPSRASGVVLWLRENLFSGPLNIALTVLGLAIIWMMFRTLLAVAVAFGLERGSMAECRKIIAETYGPDAPWRLFRDHQASLEPVHLRLLSAGLYWRPVLAFGCCFWRWRRCCSPTAPRRAASCWGWRSA
jgi:general L-amino acid transport system permease protein